MAMVGQQHFEIRVFCVLATDCGAKYSARG